MPIEEELEVNDRFVGVLKRACSEAAGSLFVFKSMINQFSPNYYVVGIDTQVKVPLPKCYINSLFSSFLRHFFSA